MFYGIDFKYFDLLLLRKFYYEWVLFYEEFSKNNYLFFFEEVMILFNYISIFRRELDYFIII